MALLVLRPMLSRGIVDINTDMDYRVFHRRPFLPLVRKGVYIFYKPTAVSRFTDKKRGCDEALHPQKHARKRHPRTAIGCYRRFEQDIDSGRPPTLPRMRKTRAGGPDGAMGNIRSHW